mmetsp:Transcript_5508/g.11261  ORF Transcript_5508/g.11261 Transcript_5508/m.11261 type:complete len:543 (-) Transcript_5508:66-1694(-)
MKLKVTIEFGTIVSEIDLACGSGAKSFKWLGLTTAARFASRAPHGTRRRREASSITANNVAYMPLEIVTEDCVFFHPDDDICDHLEDGERVTVRLGKRLGVNEVGRPEFTRWATIAFSVSDTQQEAREAALKEEYEIAAERQKRLDEEERLRLAKEYAKKAIGMRKVMISKLFDQQAQALAVSDDLRTMARNNTFDSLAKSPAAQHALRDTIKKHYFSLSEIYKNYAAATSSLGTSHEMDAVELGQFVHEIELYPNTKALTDTIHIIFEDSCIPATAAEKKANPHFSHPGHVMTMDRPGFFNAVLRLACLKYICRGSNKKMPQGQSNKQLPRASFHHLDLHGFDGAASQDGAGSAASGTGAPTQPEVTDIAEALDLFMKHYCLPLIERHLYGAVAKHAVATDEVLAMFYDHLEELKAQFHSYSSISSPEEEAAGADVDDALTITEFGMLIEDSGLIGKTSANIEDELTLKETRQAFAAAQGEEEGAGGIGLKHNQMMDFPEFVEAIARLGCLKWENGPLPVLKKIEGACLAVCNAVPRGRHK